MYWIDGCPRFSVPFNVGEDIVRAIHLDHTPLIVVLTSKSVMIYDRNTFLPLTMHTRSEDSLHQNGNNIDMQTKQVSLNAAQLQKLPTANVYIQTDKQNIIIYQVFIDYSGSLYEISSSSNDATLQVGLPSSSMSSKSILANLVKTATKHIINGGDHLPGLENIEHYENDTIDDQFGNFNIADARLSIYRVLKIGIGIKNYWLKPHSHNLIVFNNRNQKCSTNESDLPVDDNYFQIINLKNLKNEVFQLSKLDGYDANTKDSKLLYVAYNRGENYFLALNESNEVWVFFFISYDENENEIRLKGQKIHEFEESPKLIEIVFIPGTKLVLFQSLQHIKLYSISERDGTYRLNHLSDVLQHLNPSEITIDAQNGQYFTVVDKTSGYWYIYSNLGSLRFSSKSVSEEVSVNGLVNGGQDFLKASHLIKLPNAATMVIINREKTRLYYIDLAMVVHDGCVPLSLSSEYISLISNQKFVRFPLPSSYKKLIMDMEVYSRPSQKNRAYVGNLKVSSNKFNQLSLSFGNKLSVSTPYSSGMNDFNHILWSNFYNHYISSFNIIDHFWFNGFLIFVNRTVEGEDVIKDEIVIVDAESTRYGIAGTKKKFDTDLIVWRYGFDKEFIKVTCIEKSSESASLVIITKESGIISIDMSTRHTELRKNVSDEIETKPSKLYISVFKTIRLDAIKDKFSLYDIVQVRMVKKRNFLLLFNYGDLFLLRSHIHLSSNGSTEQPGIPKGVEMYDLVRVGQCVTRFKYKTLELGSHKRKYIAIFKNSNVEVYNVNDLLNANIEAQADTDADFLDVANSQARSISIETEGYLPIDIQCTVESGSEKFQSIDLIVAENAAYSKDKVVLMQSKIFHKTILNAFIQYDLENEIPLKTIYNTYSPFKTFSYCLEFLLSQLLMDTNHTLLEPLIQLIEMTTLPESIYINCLRKVEIRYWADFFAALQTDSYSFMERLLSKDNIELCYNYLIVYLNYKREGEDDSEADFTFSAADKTLITRIIKMIAGSGNWDWCFELCRFVKLLEPSGELLKSIEELLR